MHYVIVCITQNIFIITPFPLILSICFALRIVWCKVREDNSIMQCWKFIKRIIKILKYILGAWHFTVWASTVALIICHFKRKKPYFWMVKLTSEKQIRESIMIVSNIFERSPLEYGIPYTHLVLIIILSQLVLKRRRLLW